MVENYTLLYCYIYVQNIRKVVNYNPLLVTVYMIHFVPNKNKDGQRVTFGNGINKLYLSKENKNNFYFNL